MAVLLSLEPRPAKKGNYTLKVTDNAGNTKTSKKGNYTLKVTDNAGNTKTVNFKIS